MTVKRYRSAMGKTVDLGALQLKNEHVRAVGNMSVNARGDLVDATNRPIQSRNQQVKQQYHNSTRTNVSESPVSSSSSSIPTPPEDFDHNADVESGLDLADSIRRSRQQK
jgi:hypothetical protein